MVLLDIAADERILAAPRVRVPIAVAPLRLTRTASILARLHPVILLVEIRCPIIFTVRANEKRRGS